MSCSEKTAQHIGHSVELLHSHFTLLFIAWRMCTSQPKVSTGLTSPKNVVELFGCEFDSFWWKTSQMRSKMHHSVTFSLSVWTVLTTDVHVRHLQLGGLDFRWDQCWSGSTNRQWCVYVYAYMCVCLSKLCLLSTVYYYLCMMAERQVCEPYSHCKKWSFCLWFGVFVCTEGLAVGVGFGAIGKTPSATFESAR